VVLHTYQKIVEYTGKEGVHSVLVPMKVVLYGHNFSGDEAVQKWLFQADRKY
jgi:hypothetical protein